MTTLQPPRSAAGPLRLAPGCALFPSAGGGWRLYGPGDRFARIAGPAIDIAAVAALLDGGLLDPATIDPHSPTAQFVDALRARRAVLPVRTDASTRPRVLTIGDPTARRALAAACGAAVDIVEHHAAAEFTARDLDGVDAAVWIAGSLPDAAWQRFDRHCTAARIPWHMAYLEGGAVVIGPFARPGTSATYLDTRRRRLAAAAAPDELRELWAHLDGSPGAEALEPHVAALVAGFIAADLIAMAHGCDGTRPGMQLVIDLPTLAVDRHAVLPVPAFAATSDVVDG